jgi:L-methionine (R)-S-oxide reductase
LRFKYRCASPLHTTHFFQLNSTLTPNLAPVAEALHIPAGVDRDEKYQQLTGQLKSLLSGESDLVANAANFAALVHTAFGFHWVGFYWVKGEELVLGPFQGPIACTRISKGKGVCGTAWLQGETIVVPDVEVFPGHIACSALSKSEIVVPVKNGQGQVVGVLDIDSDIGNDFSDVDARFLEEWVVILAEACHV